MTKSKKEDIKPTAGIRFYLFEKEIELIGRYTEEEKKAIEKEYDDKGWIRWGACGCAQCKLNILESRYGSRRSSIKRSCLKSHSPSTRALSRRRQNKSTNDENKN